MIRNYLKIGWRNLRKNPSNSIIHITGLALGLMAFLLIQQYIAFEKSYDTFHFAPKSLYRLTTDQVVNVELKVRDAMSHSPAGAMLMEELPEILNYTTTYKSEAVVFKIGDRPIEENHLIGVDSNFLNLFNYKVLAGNKATMLTKPSSIVLTESKAKKYFGEENPIGKTIEVSEGFAGKATVTGVIEDIPVNTHYHFDILMSISTILDELEDDGWNGYNYYTYVQLDERADMAALNAKLPALSKKYMGDEDGILFNLQAVPDIYLQSDATYEPQTQGSAQAVSFLSIISIFILLIAWINYVNLSTARAMERAKEVGVRKVVGAPKSQLMMQFFMEAFIINLLGAILAVTLAQTLLPYFNNLVGKTVIDNVWNSPNFIKNLVLFFSLGTLVTGIYPALVLSSFKPIAVLRGSFGSSKKEAMMRKGLVIFQFAASLILIAGTVIIYQQIRYMTGKDIGINTEQVLGFNNPDLGDDRKTKYASFLNELRQIKGVKNAGGINDLPGGGGSDISSASGGAKIVGQTEQAKGTIYINTMDDQLAETLNMKVLAGRNFNSKLASDSIAVVINEAMLKMLGVSDIESVINQTFQIGRDADKNNFSIVGVVKDFNRTTFKDNVEPTLFFHDATPNRTVIKLEEGGVKKGLAGIETLWGKFFPSTPFTFSFLDDRFDKLYQEDKKFGLIFLNFALLAIIVASMGLFGLASYLALQRTKEVGIRKVLGASVSNIVLLFFKDFLWLIVIAVVIGVPLIYWSMSDWLGSYAYRIDFPWLVLILAVLMVTALAFFTVSIQTWKLAMLNPSKTIRTE
ncbi:MAG: putative ABC transport system permease protein [Saprospiraceae bacterium]|jgi:putative ABC transport system permease protein